MAPLAPLLDLFPDEHLVALLDARVPITVPEPARPFLLSALVRHLHRPVLVVVARIEEAENLARDVQAFLGRTGAEVFPGWEVLPGEPLSPSVETMGRRLNVIARLKRREAFAVVATAQAATQLVAPPGDHLEAVTLAPGAELALDDVAERLVAMGYERNYIVERRGEFAIRGGILDVFPPAADRPVRAELWGDEISSLRRFALASQRSLEEVEAFELAPCRELTSDAVTRQRAAELARESDDPALHQLAEGVIVAGAERLLPAIKGSLVPLASLLPEGSPPRSSNRRGSRSRR